MSEKDDRECGERPIEPEDIDAVAEAIQRETSVEWETAGRAAVAAIDTLIVRGNHGSECGERQGAALSDEQISLISEKWSARWSTGSAWNTKRCIDNALREACTLIAADAPTLGNQQDSKEFAELQGYLWQHHKSSRPAGRVGLAGWALAALKFHAASEPTNDAQDAERYRKWVSYSGFTKEQADATLDRVGVNEFAASAPTPITPAVAQPLGETAVPECNGSHDYSAIEAGIEKECTVCISDAVAPLTDDARNQLERIAKMYSGRFAAYLSPEDARALLATHNAGAQGPIGYINMQGEAVLKAMTKRDLDVCECGGLILLYTHPQPMTDAARDVLTTPKRVALIREALSRVKQDYAPECSQMADRREYVEDAVAQLIDAGYRLAEIKRLDRAKEE